VESLMVALCWMTNNLASWRLQAGLYRESHTCTPRHLTNCSRWRGCGSRW